MSKVKVGSRIDWWFSDKGDGKTTVLKILKYTGRYPQWFNCVLRLSSPNTSRGWSEAAYKM